MKAFITGISSGVGRELTRQLIHAGHEVFGIARRRELIDDLKLELGSENFHAATCDIRNQNDIERVGELMASQGFVPDVVVLNAAVDRDDVHPTFQQAVARETMETNVLGALGWVELFLEAMVARGPGQFIAISSIFAFRPDEESVSYAASKLALAMAFRGLRLRFRHTPIRFKILYLGPVATAINPRFAEAPPSGVRALFVMSARRAARAVRRVIESERNDFYAPFLSTMLVRASCWLSDRLFAALTRPFRR